MMAMDPVLDPTETEKMVLAETLADLRDLLGYLDESQWKYEQWQQ